MTRIDTADPTTKHMWHWRALLNGKDVSARCFMADDVAGEMHLFRTYDGSNDPSRFYYDERTGEPAMEIVHGEVTLVPN